MQDGFTFDYPTWPEAARDLCDGGNCIEPEVPVKAHHTNDHVVASMRMNGVGPNFNKGERKIGRRRLPPGFVAITDDPPLLRAAIAELHAYAIQRAGAPQDPCGIIFRIVTAGEIHSIGHRFINFHGVDWHNQNGHKFTPPEGHWHVLDVDALIHAHNRHSNEAIEREHGHLPLVGADYQRIPEVITPYCITGFGEKKGMPRIVYERTYADAHLIMVEELRARQGLVVKTLYKRRP